MEDVDIEDEKRSVTSPLVDPWCCHLLSLILDKRSDPGNKKEKHRMLFTRMGRSKSGRRPYKLGSNFYVNTPYDPHFQKESKLSKYY